MKRESIIATAILCFSLVLFGGSFLQRASGTTKKISNSIDDNSPKYRKTAPKNYSKANLRKIITAIGGTKTIDNTLPTSGNNYASFGAAISDLNTNGVDSGGVTFNVTAGQTFNEIPSGTIITATGNSADPIIFRKSGGGANPIVQGTNGTLSGSTNGDACITIEGGDYITFDGIDVKDNPANATATTRMEFGFRIRSGFSSTNGAQNNTIKNTTITLNRANASSIGILQTASSAIGGGSVAANIASTNSNNKYYNLTIKNVFAGIYLAGDGNGVYPDDGCEVGVEGSVTQNTIGDSAASDIGGSGQTWGIRATFQSNVKIFKNEIRNISNTNANPVDGIFLDNFGGANNNLGINEIYGNQIHDIKSTSTSTSSVSGIRVNLTGNAGSVSRVYNNFIYALDNNSTNASTRRIVGIRVQDSGSGSGATHNIDFNSVRLAPTGASCSNSAFEVATTSGPIIKVRNNIFANFTGSQTTVKHYAWSSSAALIGPTGSVSDHNILFINNTANGFIGLASGDRATLANWQAAVNQDFYSKSSDPQFNSQTNLHINPAAVTNVESGGYYFGGTISWIVQDIDGEARNANFPDIGADEGSFTPTANDTTAPDIFYTPLNNTTSTSNRNIANVQITDLSAVNITSGTKPRVYYKRSTDTNTFNDNTGSTAGWKFVEANGNTSPFDFTIDYSKLNGAGVTAPQTIQYFVVAQDLAASPNVGINSGIFAAMPASVNLTGAAFPISGIINSYNVAVSYSGVYSICNGAPYSTLKSFFDAINSGIVTGNITVTIAGNCAETAAASLNQWTEEPANSNFTMFIQPSGARTISGTVSGAVIKLNGADRVTVDGLNSGDNSLAVINTSTANNSAVIWLASLGTGQGATGNTIRNTTITGGSFGTNTSSTFGIIVGSTSISLNSFGADNDSVTIQGNAINKVQNGIYVEGTTAVPAGGNDNLVISNNIIGPAAAGANNIGATGIYVQYAISPNISGNTIRNVVAPNVFNYQGFPAGISLVNAPNGVIAQNTITNVTHPTTANAMYAMGIMSASNGARITGNLVSGVKATATNTSGNIVSAYGIVSQGSDTRIIGNVVTSIISASTTGCPARGIWLDYNDNVTLANNSVSDIQSYSYPSEYFQWQPVGIYIDSLASNVKLYYNSVNLSGTHAGSAGTTLQAALFIDGNGTNPVLDIRNNVFVNTYNNSGSSTDKSYAIYTNASPSIFTNINYNDYFTSGAASVLGAINVGGTTTDQTTLNGWRAATGQDAQSLVGDPLFTSATDLHITSSLSAVSNAGTPIAEINTDFDGTTRNASTPDIGADEFSSPTAAAVNIGGRVVKPNKRGIFRARVTMTDSQGEARTAFTNQFGYYRFTEVPAGETYVFSVNHLHYQFAQSTQIQSVTEDTFGINFVALSTNE